MSRRKEPGGAVGKGGVNPAPADGGLVQVAATKWELSDRERQLVRELGRGEG